MHRTLALAALLASFASPGAAQRARRPTRYLFLDPPAASVEVRVRAPAPVLPVVPEPVLPVVPEPVLPVVPEPAPTPQPNPPRWFVGAGTGALIRFDGAGRDATASYRLDLGVAVGGAEFGLHFDLAPRFQRGAEPAALYTAGAAFGYRGLPGSRLHPIVGLGMESLFLNPQGAGTARAFAFTARLGLELDVPSAFGALAVGFDLRAHQPVAGAPKAQATFLGLAAHLALRFD